MKLPQHQNPRTDREAKAPYNFVPLPEKVLPAEPADLDAYHPGRHTGWFDCLLTTETPLYVRCGLLPEQSEKEKDRPAFFFTDPTGREPVIPGSSLRGMLRALVEIVGYGKVQPVTSQPLIYRAVGDTSSLGTSYRGRLLHMRAGYMRQRGHRWEIIPARPLNGAAFARVEQADIRGLSLPRWQNAQNASVAYVALAPLEDYSHNNGKVTLRYVKATRVSANPGPGLQQAVIVRTGPMNRKHQEFVFGLPESDPGKAISVDNALIEAYREQITKEQKKILGEEGVLQDDQPVFYLLEQDRLTFFGHAMMMRLPYLRSPQDFVPPALRNPDQTDLAEALFGYVEEKSTARDVARAGRVFVTDAPLLPGQGNIWVADRPITPRILGSPKPTTFQHYLVQTAPNDKASLRHYASPTPQETVIRGHKLYWHKQDLKRRDWEEKPTEIKSDGQDTQHTQIMPVREGVRFRFRVYFEDLDDGELGALLWLFNLGAAENYRFKLGMGKPLGLGSVKIEATLHLTDRVARYRQLFDQGGWAVGETGGKAGVEKVRAQAVQAFERRVLSDPEINLTDARHLHELERIKMLLYLLQWPGPDKGKTRYLEIEHPQNDNEYKNRPVLPTPEGVRSDAKTSPHSPSSPDAATPAGTGALTSAPAQGAARHDRPPTAASQPPLSPPVTPPTAPSSAPKTVKRPARVEEIGRGDVLEGRVIAVDDNRIRLDFGLAGVVGTMGLTQLDEWVRQDYLFQEYWELGKPRPDAQFLQQEGALEIAIKGKAMQVRVRRVKTEHGKTQVQVELVGWVK